MVEDILMEDRHQESPKPEIWETEEEKRLSVVALKKKYIAFARSRFIHNPRMAVRNIDTQWLIELSNRVINHKINITVKKILDTDRRFVYYYSASSLEA
jgi:hypothetical protein